MKIIEENIYSIAELCKKFKVHKLYAFGSVITKNFNDNSDIDLLVSFKEDQNSDFFLIFFDFIYALEDLLGRKIDLVDESAIANSFFKEQLLSTRKLIYG